MINLYAIVARRNLEVKTNVQVVIKKRTDKKEVKIFLIYKEIQNGAVAKS